MKQIQQEASIAKEESLNISQKEKKAIYRVKLLECQVIMHFSRGMDNKPQYSMTPNRHTLNNAAAIFQHVLLTLEVIFFCNVAYC